MCGCIRLGYTGHTLIMSNVTDIILMFLTSNTVIHWFSLSLIHNKCHPFHMCNFLRKLYWFYLSQFYVTFNYVHCSFTELLNSPAVCMSLTLCSSCLTSSEGKGASGIVESSYVCPNLGTRPGNCYRSSCHQSLCYLPLLARHLQTNSQYLCITGYGRYCLF